MVKPIIYICSNLKKKKIHSCYWGIHIYFVPISSKALAAQSDEVVRAVTTPINSETPEEAHNLDDIPDEKLDRQSHSIPDLLQWLRQIAQVSPF